MGTTTASVTVTVIQKPVIASFTATPSTVSAGQASTLAWTVTGTDPQLGAYAGTVAVRP